jgi:hypothetical protein
MNSVGMKIATWTPSMIAVQTSILISASDLIFLRTLELLSDNINITNRIGETSRYFHILIRAKSSQWVGRRIVRILINIMREVLIMCAYLHKAARYF